MPSIQYYNSVVGEQVKVIGQNVGIGTSTPSAKLNVENGNLVFNDLGGNFDFRVEGDTDANLLFTDASTDRVGIGTSTPQAKLDVNGTVQFDNLVRWEFPDKPIDTNISALGYLRLYDESSTYCGLGVSSSSFNIGSVGGINLRFLTNGTERTIIDTNGNFIFNEAGNNCDFRIEGDTDANLLFTDASTDRVGIGTIQPSQKLDVNGRVKANLFVTQDPRSATNLPVGWYTIAVNVGNRAIGRFGLTCESGGRHQGIIFYASHYYGLGNQISILHNNRYSGSNPIAKLRIKEGGTYDGCLLQVYIDDATNTPTVYLLNDNISTTGWNLVSLTADGTNPGGVSNFANLNNVAVEVDLDSTDFGTTGQSIFQGNVGIGTDSPSYKLDVNGTFSANSINVNDQFTFPTVDGSSGQALVTNGSGVVSWSDIASANLTRGSFEVTSTQSTFTVSGGYTLNTLSVYYNGIKLLLGTDFTATNGTTFTLTNAAVNGDIVEYWALNSASSAVGNTSTGSVSVTSNQTVFNVTNGYTVGGLIVFVNGVKLVDGVDFTATNGSSFTLTSTATSGDVVDYVAYGAVVASSNLQKTGDTMTGNLTIGNGSDLIVEGDLIVAKYKEGFVDGGNSSTSKTIDITSGTLQTVTLTGNCTFTMPPVEAGRSFTLLLKTGTGSYTSTFTGVKWPSDSAPTITTTASKLDILTFVSDGTNWYGNIAQNYSV